MYPGRLGHNRIVGDVTTYFGERSKPRWELDCSARHVPFSRANRRILAGFRTTRLPARTAVRVERGKSLLLSELKLEPTIGNRCRGTALTDDRGCNITPCDPLPSAHNVKLVDLNGAAVASVLWSAYGVGALAGGADNLQRCGIAAFQEEATVIAHALNWQSNILCPGCAGEGQAPQGY